MKIKIDLSQDESKNVFFTSDFHLFHKNVIKFDNRPFENVHEMHLMIEKRWNEVVTDNDIVIYLGDLSFAKSDEKNHVKELVERLNGEIHFVLGNHDRFDEIKKIPRFKTVNDYLEVRITHPDYTSLDSSKKVLKDTTFCCMHYPIYSWNKSHHGSYMVHGHSHMSLSMGEFHKNKRIIDVGVMGYNYKPVSYKEIIAKLEFVDFKISTTHH